MRCSLTMESTVLPQLLNATTQRRTLLQLCKQLLCDTEIQCVCVLPQNRIESMRQCSVEYDLNTVPRAV